MVPKAEKVKTLTSVTGRAALPSRYCSGFTLLELVAVLTIAALMVAVSAPNMQKMYQSMQYRGAVGDVVGALNGGRYAAIRTGVQQDILVNPRTREVTHGDAVKTLPSSIELDVLGSRELNRDGAGVIRFYPDGGSSGGYVSLALEGGQAVQVQVAWLLGRVSLCKSDCGEPTAL